MTLQSSPEEFSKSSQHPVTLFPQIPLDTELVETTLEAQKKAAYWLRFAREDERRFQVFYGKTSLLFSRATLGLAIIGYVLFGFADLWSLPISYPKAWLIRYAVICPIYGLVVALSFRSKWSRSIPRLTGITHVMGGLGLMAIMTIQTSFWVCDGVGMDDDAGVWSLGNLEVSNVTFAERNGIFDWQSVLSRFYEYCGHVCQLYFGSFGPD
jgi:hypothetical protein